jgi:hypothetical protein
MNALTQAFTSQQLDFMDTDKVVAYAVPTTKLEEVLLERLKDTAEVMRRCEEAEDELGDVQRELDALELKAVHLESLQAFFDNAVARHEELFGRWPDPNPADENFTALLIGCMAVTPVPA